MNLTRYIIAVQSADSGKWTTAHYRTKTSAMSHRADFRRTARRLGSYRRVLGPFPVVIHV